jgi:diguanylate cyclase (GGDEF)-like protein
VARAARGGGALALAVLDLDQFKPVNDEYGHRAGDACLEHFASILSRNLRAGDWAARWGGDEFSVGLWEGQGASSAEGALERLAEQLREAPLVLPGGQKARLSFSGGVGRWREGEDAEGLFRRADAALYRAKEAGGDTVAYAD